MALNITYNSEFPAYDCEGKNASILLNLLGPLQPSRCKRRPVALTCVIDRSGSMSGSKIALVKQTLLFMLDTLKEDDIFGLVVFDSRADEVYPACVLTPANRDRAMLAVEYIQAGSSTFLSGGLFAGIDQQNRLELPRPSITLDQLAKYEMSHWLELQKQVEEHKSRLGAARCLLLFTDGKATNGFTTAADLVPELRQRLETTIGRDLILHTFGFGSDHDSKFLETIAEAGAAGGNFHYIENENVIADAFSSALGGLFSTSARDVVLKLTPRNGVSIAAISRQRSPAAASSNLSEVKVGNVLYEAERNILVDLQLPASAAPAASQEVLDVTVSYKDVADRPQEQKLCVMLERTKEPCTARANQKVVDNRVRVEVAAGIQAALESASTLGLDRARTELAEQLQRLSTSAPRSDQTEAYLSEANTVLGNMMNDRFLSTENCRRANATSRAHTTQQHVGLFGGSSSGVYSNPVQRQMAVSARTAISQPRNLYQSAPPTCQPPGSQPQAQQPGSDLLQTLGTLSGRGTGPGLSNTTPTHAPLGSGALPPPGPLAPGVPRPSMVQRIVQRAFRTAPHPLPAGGSDGMNAPSADILSATFRDFSDNPLLTGNFPSSAGTRATTTQEGPTDFSFLPVRAHSNEASVQNGGSTGSAQATTGVVPNEPAAEKA